MQIFNQQHMISIMRRSINYVCSAKCAWVGKTSRWHTFAFCYSNGSHTARSVLFLENCAQVKLQCNLNIYKELFLPLAVHTYRSFRSRRRRHRPGTAVVFSSRRYTSRPWRRDARTRQSPCCRWTKRDPWRGTAPATLPTYTSTAAQRRQGSGCTCCPGRLDAAHRMLKIKQKTNIKNFNLEKFVCISLA